MKKTWKVFLTLVTALVAVVLVACGQGTASKDNKESELKKIDFILLTWLSMVRRHLQCISKTTWLRS